jgi:membrane protein required for colicin V production
MMSMSVVDLLVLGVLVVGFVLGLVRGFLSQVIGLAGVVGGVYLAWRYAGPVQERVVNPILTTEYNGSIAFVAILLLVVGLVGLLGWIVRKIFTKLEMGAYDRLMGGLFGTLKAGLVCAGVLLGLVYFATDDGEIERAIGSSRAGQQLWRAMDRAVDILPEPARGEMREFLDENDLPRPAPPASEPPGAAHDLRVQDHPGPGE